MKSIKNDETERRPSVFPCLMINVNKTIIILFSKFNIGSIVWVDTDLCKYKIGDYSMNWAMDGFLPYDGKVTLKN